MGTYTEFDFTATLNKDTPQQVLDFVKACLTPTDETTDVPPLDNHPFFKCTRWDSILTRYIQFDRSERGSCEMTPSGLTIRIRSKLKNYDNEITCFLCWIADFVNTDLPCSAYQCHEAQAYGSLKPTVFECSPLLSELSNALEERNAVNLKKTLERLGNNWFRLDIDDEQVAAISRYRGLYSTIGIMEDVKPSFGL